MKYRFKIVWLYEYGDQLHVTYVEARSQRLLAAAIEFEKFFRKFHDHKESNYIVDSCVLLGPVVKKCW